MGPAAAAEEGAWRGSRAGAARGEPRASPPSAGRCHPGLQAEVELAQKGGKRAGEGPSPGGCEHVARLVGGPGDVRWQGEGRRLTAVGVGALEGDVDGEVPHQRAPGIPALGRDLGDALLQALRGQGR